MIRKAIIVGMTLGAILAGIVGVVGEVQGYLDPGAFHNASDRPELHWLNGKVDLGSRLQIMVNSYHRGSLAIHYNSLPIRSWYRRTDVLIRLPGLSVYTIQRCPISLSSATGPPAGTIYQQAGWIIVTPFRLISLVSGVYPLAVFIRGTLRRWRRKRKGLCLKCGYDLTGNVTGICSECGVKVSDSGNGDD